MKITKTLAAHYGR